MQENETRVEIYSEDLIGPLRALVIGDLDKLPQVILNSEKAMLLKKTDLEDVNQVMETIEETYRIQILESGLYPNQQKRDAELQARLTRHTDYPMLEKKARELKQWIADEQIKLNFYQNKFSAAKGIARLIQRD